MNFKIFIFIFIVVNISNVHAYDNSVVTNIYSQVAKLYEGHKIHGKSVSAFSRFVGVRGGGVKNEFFDEEMSKFTNLVTAVSNNCLSIATDWQTYETNEMVRFTVLSAVGYAGYGNYTNFVNTIVVVSQTNSMYCTLETLDFLISPYGTPGEAYLGLNFHESTISNILDTIRYKANIANDTNIVSSCDAFLSGEWKREYLDMKTSGGL